MPKWIPLFTNLLPCWGFGGLFVYAGFLKLWGLGPMSFANDIRSFHILADPWVAWLAMSLPWLEIFCGLAVICGPLRRGGLIVLNVSLLIFLGALISALARGIEISCGCFGHEGAASSTKSLIQRDLWLLALGGWLLWVFFRKRIPA